MTAILRSGRYGDPAVRSFSDGAFELDAAVEFRNSFPYALESEMALEDSGRGAWLEPAAVVGDGDEDMVAVYASSDANMRGVSMAKSVDDQFPNDAQECVFGGVMEEIEWQIAADRQSFVVDVRLESRADGSAKLGFIQGIAAKIP